MGIHGWFSYVRKNFSEYIKMVRLSNNDLGVFPDILLIDMNGIIHYCCQKKYKYGLFKQPKSFFFPNRQIEPPKLNDVFKEVTNYLDNIIDFVKPTKKIVMAIDGVAPYSKACQQRRRRFRSSFENSGGIFDSCSITPGTEFLELLGSYIDRHIKKKDFGGVEVIFSSSKNCGEGEHKLVKYVRDFGLDDETYMIFGMDADLFMLSLATHKENFHILRESQQNYEEEFYHIDMKKIRNNIVDNVMQEQSLIQDKIHINDFILMIFMIGNDFLPKIQSVEITLDFVENLFGIYRNVVKSYGPLTNSNNSLMIEPLQVLFGTMAERECDFISQRKTNFPDSLVEKHTIDGKLNFNTYRDEYYFIKMECKTEDDIKKACVEYIEGLQWVLSYYTEGVPCWKWSYKYNYAPFLSDINRYMKHYEKKLYKKSSPLPPFMQLLCVLPPKSWSLLPVPLGDIIRNPEEGLKHHFPEKIVIDMDGKDNSWEAVVVLPHLDYKIIEKEYEKKIGFVDKKDLKRNLANK